MALNKLNTLNKITIGVGSVGQSWSNYWATRTEVLFFGEISKITGGRLYNQKSGATDYLTVGGSAGSYTFQCPNTAAYIAADTDYIWFQLNENRRTTTEAELIGYDFTRTIVKYEDVSDYSIQAIMILSSNVDTAKMRNDFHLSAWWDGTFNLNGHIKANRTTARSVWTIEAVWDAEIMTYRAALTTPLSTATYNKLDTLVKSLKTALTITNLSEAIDQILVYANQTEEAALRNIVQNSYHATNVHSTLFTAYEGFTGDGANDYINTGYNPSGFPGNYKQNSATIIYCIRNNVLQNATQPSHGSQSGGSIRIGCNPNRITNFGGMYVNGSTRVDYNNGGSGVGYHTGVRNEATVALAFKNKTKTIGASNNSSSSVYNGNLFDLCDNLNGTPTAFIAEQIAIKMVLRGISDAEQGAIIDALEAYMDSNSKGVI